MSPIRNLLRCASLLALLVLVAGCSGFNLTKSWSPIDLLLPGAGSLLKADPAPAEPGFVPSNPAEQHVILVA